MLPVVAPPAAASASAAAPAAPTPAEAAAFVADVEQRLRDVWTRGARADWINQTYITDDTEALSADAAAETAKVLGEAITASRRFDSIKSQLPADVARKLYLLSIAQTVPAPADAAARKELTTLEAAMTAEYGKGEYCPPAGSPLLAYLPKGEAKAGKACLHIGELSKVLAKSHKWDELVEAWRGWHAIARPMKAQYARYVELSNRGAKEIGFADVGALWKSSWDMPPADFEADVERLWNDVKPLYDDLHCYVRGALQKTYGKDKVPDHAPIPAQLLGNMWAQEWDNVYDQVTPYPKEPALDVDKKLSAGKWDSVKMVKQGERFFTGLGFDPLPPTFWDRSLLSRPRDRDVVCHASAWDVTYNGDLRIKACFEPTEHDLLTVHHELGHDFYYQRYFQLPVLFQSGANGGFHEAIGDTVALSVTPDYLKTIGLLGAVPKGDHARINEQMKQALEKVAFLPFGLILDKWRWDVFAGKVTPDHYEDAWWALKNKYQGVSAPAPRSAEDFDPGAKYHVASSSTYVIYFLARIYQFQFHKALCQAAGYSGPLDQCSIHDNKVAGGKLLGMLAMGASKPWPDAMEAIGAGRKADAAPMLEYFAPLRAWLADQNKGKTCGW
jgi:peptidyl-dipeptidase A